MQGELRKKSEPQMGFEPTALREQGSIFWSQLAWNIIARFTACVPVITWCTVTVQCVSRN